VSLDASPSTAILRKSLDLDEVTGLGGVTQVASLSEIRVVAVHAVPSTKMETAAKAVRPKYSPRRVTTVPPPGAWTTRGFAAEMVGYGYTYEKVTVVLELNPPRAVVTLKLGKYTTNIIKKK
jgi:hypothetical protein